MWFFNRTQKLEIEGEHMQKKFELKIVLKQLEDCKRNSNIIKEKKTEVLSCFDKKKIDDVINFSCKKSFLQFLFSYNSLHTHCCNKTHICFAFFKF